MDRDGRFFFFVLAFGPSLAAGIGDLAAMSALAWGVQNTTATRPTLSSSFPSGVWPGDKGAAERGKRDGCGAKEGKRRFHRGVKGNDNMSRPTDQYGVDPSNGNVYDPEGEVIGNLNDE
jgi:hypothetical protein